jgi:Spy/CpxP family protein refolding chaperone
VNTWKVILATLVIFIAGVVTGGLLVRYTEQNAPRRGERSAPPRPAQPGAAGLVRMDFLRRVQKELDLTPDQHQRVDKMLKEHQEQIKKIVEPIEPDIQEEVQTAKDEFLETLTPTQRVRFDELLKQQQRPKDPRRPQPPHLSVAPTLTNEPATNR